MVNEFSTHSGYTYRRNSDLETTADEVPSVDAIEDSNQGPDTQIVLYISWSRTGADTSVNAKVNHNRITLAVCQSKTKAVGSAE